MTPNSKFAAFISGTGTPASKSREFPLFLGTLLSQWDARHAGDGAAQSSGRVSDPLTARESDVLAMIGQGLSNKRIARALEISPETVKSHVKHIFLKLEVGTRAEAVSRAGIFGLLPYGSPHQAHRVSNVTEAKSAGASFG
jgi:DNA-binding CsgD family transcriptional regulator